MSKIKTTLDLEARAVLDFRRLAARQNTTPEALMIELIEGAAATVDDMDGLAEDFGLEIASIY